MSDLATKNQKLVRQLRDKQRELDNARAKLADWERELRRFSRGDFNYQLGEEVEFDIRDALVWCHNSYSDVYNKFQKLKDVQTQTTTHLSPALPDPALTTQGFSQVVPAEDVEMVEYQEGPAAMGQFQQAGAVDPALIDPALLVPGSHQISTSADVEMDESQDQSRPATEKVSQVQSSGTQTEFLPQIEKVADEMEGVQTLSDFQTTSQGTQTEPWREIEKVTETMDQGVQALPVSVYTSQSTQTDPEPEIETAVEAVDQGVQAHPVSAYVSQGTQTDSEPEIETSVETVDQGVQASPIVQFASQATQTDVTETVDRGTQVDFDLESDAARNRVLQAQLAVELEKNSLLTQELAFQKSFGARSLVRAALEHQHKLALSQISSQNEELQAMQQQLDAKTKMVSALRKRRADSEKLLANYENLKKQYDQLLQSNDQLTEQLQMQGETAEDLETPDWERVAEDLEQRLKASMEEVEDLNLALQLANTQKFCVQKQLRKTHDDHAETTKDLRRGIQRKDAFIAEQEQIIQVLRGDINLARRNFSELNKLYNLTDKGSASDRLQKKLKYLEVQLQRANARVSHFERLVIDRDVEISSKDSDIQRLSTERDYLQKLVLALEEEIQNLVKVREAEDANALELAATEVAQIAKPELKEVTEEVQDTLDPLEPSALPSQVSDHQKNLLIEQGQDRHSLGGVDDRYTAILRGILAEADQNGGRIPDRKGRLRTRRINQKKPIQSRNVSYRWFLTILFCFIIVASMMLFGENSNTVAPHIPVETTTILQTIYHSTTKHQTEFRTITETSPPDTLLLTEIQTETATIMQVFPTVTPQSDHHASSVVPYKSSLTEHREYYVNPNPASIAVGSILLVFVAWACRIFR